MQHIVAQLEKIRDMGQENVKVNFQKYLLNEKMPVENVNAIIKATVENDLFSKNIKKI